MITRRCQNVVTIFHLLFSLPPRPPPLLCFPTLPANVINHSKKLCQGWKRASFPRAPLLTKFLGDNVVHRDGGLRFRLEINRASIFNYVYPVGRKGINESQPAPAANLSMFAQEFVPQQLYLESQSGFSGKHNTRGRGPACRRARVHIYASFTQTTKKHNTGDGSTKRGEKDPSVKKQTKKKKKRKKATTLRVSIFYLITRQHSKSLPRWIAWIRAPLQEVPFKRTARYVTLFVALGARL